MMTSLSCTLSSCTHAVVCEFTDLIDHRFVNLQAHFADARPAFEGTLAQWLGAGLLPANRVCKFNVTVYRHAIKVMGTFFLACHKLASLMRKTHVSLSGEPSRISWA